MTDTTAAPHLVLARKYRPETFSQLIGQDGLVRTLTNAFESGRIAHAFMLTGVRGTGKTTTARIIARALNCTGRGDGPTSDPCGTCDECVAISESRYIDVVEMDAASHTGVDDVRELIKNVPYRPVAGRYKINIIDEVHMLSTSAFNALLKTLEEPPAHMKFVFATTELRKVPVTVQSRCQRFDLRRVEMTELTEHFRGISEKEELEIEDDALTIIARAADGSVRDGLSLLERAFASAVGPVTGAAVVEMLGLVDRAKVFDLLDLLFAGDTVGALNLFEDMHRDGADPAEMLRDILDAIYWMTRIKVIPDVAKDPYTPETERVRGVTIADKLDMPALTRAWQLLLKGVEEVKDAPNASQAAEMVLIRLAFAADLPSPAKLIHDLKGQAAATPAVAPATTSATTPAGTAPTSSAPAAPSTDAPQSADASPPIGFGGSGGAAAASVQIEPARSEPAEAEFSAENPNSFPEVVALFRNRRELLLSRKLEDSVHLVSFEPGRISCRLADSAGSDLVRNTTRHLQDWTGTPWVVVLSNDEGDPTLAEQARMRKDEVRDLVEQNAAVRAIRRNFPDAKIVKVTEREGMEREGMEREETDS